MYTLLGNLNERSYSTWPGCGHVPHNFHTVCLLQLRSLHEGLAHFANTSGRERLHQVSCPLCHQSGGYAAMVRLLEELEQENIPFPASGCPCSMCRGADEGIVSSLEDSFDYFNTVRPNPDAPVPHAFVMCPIHPGTECTWSVSQFSSGWTGSWSCSDQEDYENCTLFVK